MEPWETPALTPDKCWPFKTTLFFCCLENQLIEPINSQKNQTGAILNQKISL